MIVKPLQPFRRPSLITAEETRDAVVARVRDIRSTYAVRHDPDELRAVANPLASTDAAGVPVLARPGDLHDWDKLVDGCLYYDADDKGSRPYLFAIGGECDWVSRNGQFDNEWGDHGGAYKTPTAMVIAVLDPNMYSIPTNSGKIVLPSLQVARVRTAIQEHRTALKAGGTK